MDKSVDEENTDQIEMDDEEATDAVLEERVEDREIGSKKRKMGDKMDAVDSRLDISLPAGEVSPVHIPQSRDQDKGRLQMLLERALAVRTNQATSIEDPKDRRYKHLLEEMQLVEKSFTHCLKEIEMRDRRIVILENDLVKSEEQNQILKCELERAHGCTRDN